MTKNALFRYFWTGVLKKYCQRPWIYLHSKFGANIKTLKFYTKNA